MQQQGGFLDQGNKSPTSLMLVAGMHVAAISALILFPPKFITPEGPHIFTVDSIVEPPPPPPIKDPPPPKTEKEAVTKPVIVGPATPRTPGPEYTELEEPWTPPIPPVVGGDPIPNPPIPAPVLTEAVADPRAPFQPSYPPRLARQEIEGKVVVRVLIGSDGRVKAVEQVSATDPEFFDAAKKQALRFWRFKPATRDGVAIESWRTMTLRFELKA